MTTFDADDFDELGNWTGTCEQCGTSHEGHGPDTLGGIIRCLRTQAELLGAPHLVDQVDAFDRDVARRRDDFLRAQGWIP